MTTHPDDRQLHDYADGILAAREHDALHAHLAVCDACRRDMERIRHLRADLAALPRDVPPPARVLAAIHAATAGSLPGETPAPAHSGSTRWHARPRILAAAALVLVTLSSAATMLVQRAAAPRPESAAVAAPSSGTALVAVDAMERSYEDAIAELQRALADGDSGLSPETVRVLETNLALIDRALAEARTALRADPGNDALAALVRSGYERKLDVLRSVSSHARARS